MRRCDGVFSANFRGWAADATGSSREAALTRSARAEKA
jgi:hypothetical protein